MGTGAVSILGVPLLVGEGSGVPLLLPIVRSRFDEPDNGLSNRSGVLLCLSCRNQGQGCPIGTSGQPQPPGQHTQLYLLPFLHRLSSTPTAPSQLAAGL